jgi:CHAT domain-containing protein
MTIAKDAGLGTDAADWAKNLAAAYVHIGRWDEAEKYNEEARRLTPAEAPAKLLFNTLHAARIAAGRGQMDAAARLANEALRDPNAHPSVRWAAYDVLAGVALRSGDNRLARSHFEAALETIEKTRSDLLKTDYKLSFLTQLIRFYRAYVAALVEQGDIARALEVADSSRGRVMAERHGITAPTRGSARSFQALARRTATVMLSYWLAPERSFVWAVTPQGVRFHELPPSGEIELAVREHQARIENALADPLAGNTAGDRLYRMLVQPLAEWVPAGGRAVIVPDGVLHRLNFETLPVSGAPPRYWIEDVTVQIAPSLALLEPARSAPPRRSLLLIGNPSPRGVEFPALRYAAAEMTAVSRHFPSAQVTTYQADRASPRAYHDAAPDRYGFVHFTAHAAANLESPLDSAVILSGHDDSYKLYARDVAEERLQAELVTVSACRSAGEHAYSGEGLVGFAWAFLRAGARRVVAGLWDVDDRSTAELMDRMYARLAAGDSPAAALRAAKLEAIRQKSAYAKPYFWGPFQIFTLSP